MRVISLTTATASLAILLAISGCGGAPLDDGSANDGTATALGSDGLDQPWEDVPPATAPPGTLMPDQAAMAAHSPAHWDGFGDAQFGMDSEQVRMVWPGPLNGQAAEGSSCYHLSPAGDDDIGGVALMFEDGPFVRYSVSNDDITAPGGGRWGMDADQIDALYPGRVQKSGHEYVSGGNYLRIEQGGSGRVLVFETDAAGIVTEWRVGVAPQVDYSEGCS